MTKSQLWIALFCMCSLGLFAQDIRVYDSLKEVIKTNEPIPDSLYYYLLRRLSFHSNDVDTMLYYAQMHYDKALESDNKEQMSVALANRGNSHRIRGDYFKAVGDYLNAIDLAQTTEIYSSSLIALADTYSVLGQHSNALKYYHEAIVKISDNPKQLATVYLNLGDEHFNQSNLDSALLYFAKAESEFNSLNHIVGLAYAKGNIGLVLAELEQTLEAEKNIQEAVDILEEMEDFYGISVYLTYMADIYEEKESIPSALKYASKSLQLAMSHRLKEQVRDASLKLSELYELQGNIDSAYHHHKQYVAFRDSINNEETIQKIADLRTEYEVGQKQAEVDVLTTQRNMERVVMLFITILAIVLLILGLIVYKYYKQKSRTNRELERLNQTKDKFFSIISHDLRGPVSSFLGISRMIKYMVKAKETDQLLEVADDIDESVLRLSELLDNLLSWAMQQQGHFPNVPEKIRLQEAAHDLVKTLDTMARSKKINLKTEIDGPIELWADKNTTMTILRNLVNNALKFTPEHGEVIVSAREKKGFAHIRVSDTGVGIPKEKVARLFELQDKKSTYGTSGEKGLGLGLQLVYEFVEMNNGSINVESKEDQGTTFEIRLPLFAAERPRELVL